MRKIGYALDENCIINGHTAGASGKKLAAYIASGIISCHEPTDFAQTIERLRLGMWVMVREGSIRRDLEHIIRDVLLKNTYTDRMMFCTDGLDTRDMKKFGHMDHCVQKSIDLGMDPVRAITIASRNCFDYYGMSKDLGGIAPGRLADMLILKDLKKPCNIEKVFVGGVLVAANGKIIKRTKKPAIPSWLNKTVKLAKLHAKDFVVKSHSSTAVANTIRLETEIVTRNSSAQLEVRDGNVCASPEARYLESCSI